MLSALIISPLIFLLNSSAKLDLPEAVGPAIRMIFFCEFNLFVRSN
tara:strand:- start:130 stop:267 length:138 start_codon:yes stop_codon:yes gene_type:complete